MVPGTQLAPNHVPCQYGYHTRSQDQPRHLSAPLALSCPPKAMGLTCPKVHSMPPRKSSSWQLWLLGPWPS